VVFLGALPLAVLDQAFSLRWGCDWGARAGVVFPVVFLGALPLAVLVQAFSLRWV
jgi:hypothetical protein